MIKEHLLDRHWKTPCIFSSTDNILLALDIKQMQKNQSTFLLNIPLFFAQPGLDGGYDLRSRGEISKSLRWPAPASNLLPWSRQISHFAHLRTLIEAFGESNEKNVWKIFSVNTSISLSLLIIAWEFWSMIIMFHVINILWCVSYSMKYDR